MLWTATKVVPTAHRPCARRRSGGESPKHRSGRVETGEVRVKPQHTPITACSKDASGKSNTPVATHVQRPHRDLRPSATPSERKKNAADRERRIRQAMRLIRAGATRWTQLNLRQSSTLQNAVRGWLGDKRFQESRKYRSVFRELEKTHQQAKERLAQNSRATGAQREHPNRNAITAYRAASGNSTWATRKTRR